MFAGPNHKVIESLEALTSKPQVKGLGFDVCGFGLGSKALKDVGVWSLARVQSVGRKGSGCCSLTCTSGVAMLEGHRAIEEV